MEKCTSKFTIIKKALKMVILILTIIRIIYGVYELIQLKINQKSNSDASDEDGGWEFKSHEIDHNEVSNNMIQFD